MATVVVEGQSYKVIDRLGFVPDVGGQVVEVETETGSRKAVRVAGAWVFWTSRDRVAPLLAAKKGSDR